MTDSNSPLRPVLPRPAVGGRLLASLAVGFAAACLAFWLSLAILPPSGLSAFSELALGPTLVLAGVSTWVWCHRLTQTQRQAMRYFDELSRRDSQGSEGGAAAGGLRLPSTNPWHGVASRFTESFGVLSEQRGEIEQARAAFEIRLRRDAARQRQTESILANLSEPLVAINSFDEVVLINDAARRLFDLDEESTIGQPVSRALRCERLAGLLLDARRRGSPAQRMAEIEWTDETGASRWFGAVARSLPADDRHSVDDRRSLGAFVVLRDIAEIKTGQKRYAEFVSAVSHEMKSPLAGIKAYVELLADCDAADSAAREEFLGVIDSQANRLQRLIDNLLNIARIEAGVVEVSKDSISLNELLGEALEIVRPSAEAKQIRLSAEFSPMYLGVLADRDMLMQVAINLLSNAIKYTPERRFGRAADADDRRRSRIRSGRHRRRPRRGRSAQSLREVLSRQERSRHGPRDRPRPAAGQAHRRRRARRPDHRRKHARRRQHVPRFAPGRGSTGVLAEAKVRPAASATKTHRISTETNHLVRRRDRDPAGRGVQAQRGGLRRARAPTTAKMPGARSNARLPDLVVTDLQMPRLDGFGLCRRIRENPLTRDLPVIMLTAKGFELSPAESTEKYGIAKLMVKPFSPRELLRNVEQILGRSANRQSLHRSQ